MNTLLFVTYTLLVFFLLLRWKRFRSDQLGGYAYLLVLALKIALALFFLYYPISYLHDGPLFIGESKQLANLFLTEPLTYFKFLTGIGENYDMVLEYMKDTIYWDKPHGIYNDSKSLVRFNSILQLLSFRQDSINLIWIAVLNIIGLQGIYRATVSISSGRKNLLFLLIFLLPSTLLWGMSVLKETYLILAIGLILEGLFYAVPNQKKILLVCSGTLLLLLFKPYILACIVAGVAGYVLYRKIPFLKAPLTIAVLVCGAGLSLLATRGTKLDLTAHISRKQFDFINLANGGIWIETDTCYIGFPMEKLTSFNLKTINKITFIQAKDTITGLIRTHGEENNYVLLRPDSTYHYVIHFLEPSGSKIAVTEINNSLSVLISTSPQALFNSLLRPLPNDPPAKIEKWYFILENWLFIILVAYALFKSRLATVSNQALVVGLLTFALSLALLIGWTTPVLGAIIRYKLPIVFTFILLTWLLLYPAKPVRR